MEQILRYIQETYDPLSIILYGSYADGTNGLNSDFDALVITTNHEQFHDTSFVDGVPLDVFVYPARYFESSYSCEDFVQIFDGRIVADSGGIGKALQETVRAYLKNRPSKTGAELQADIDWCVKMSARAKRCDCEGLFRWHWLLIDSLEIFCDIMHQPYLGPKKALKWMEKTHPEAFDRYEKALQNFRLDDLDEWIGYIKNAGKPDRQLPVSRTELDEEGNPYPLVYESGTDGDM